MREIKFRARWKDTGKIITDFMTNFTIQAINNGMLIVEQSTGLLDKNGKEIYEGDICKQDWSTPLYEPIIVTVEYGGEYRDAGFGITCKRNEEMMGHGSSPTWDRLNDRIALTLEVIGNIHEK